MSISAAYCFDDSA